MARKKRQIDLDLVKKLAGIQCTIKEISIVLEIPESTLKSRKDFMQAYQRGRETGKISLRRTQWRLAENNVAMAIWLGKQYLEQREPTINLGLTSVPEFENMSDDQLLEFIKSKLDKVKDDDVTKSNKNVNEKK
jgi:hypothetical protein